MAGLAAKRRVVTPRLRQEWRSKQHRGASLAGHHVQPCLLRVGEGVRQPDGDSCGDRQDRASLGHTGVRPAKLPDQCGTESAGRRCVAPAKLIVASTTNRRSCEVRNQQSDKESDRQNLLTHPAKMDAPIHVKRLYRASGWASGWPSRPLEPHSASDIE